MAVKAVNETVSVWGRVWTK